MKHTATTHRLHALIGTVQRVRLISAALPDGLTLTPDPCIVAVKIAAVKNAYGVPRILVEPVPGYGTGSAWINADRLQEVTKP